MKKKEEIEISELSMVIAAKNHNPTILNPDFLKFNEIVPAEWELSEAPLCVEPVAQVSYKNEIKITAHLEMVSFTEQLQGKAVSEAKTPEIALKYVETLPHVNFKAVGINPQACVRIESNEEASDFILSFLISDGPWKEYKNSRPQAAVQFTYQLENTILNVSVRCTSKSDNDQNQLVAFAANFHRGIEGETAKQKVDAIKGIISAWATDISTFKDLVENYFLVKVKE